MCVLTTLLIVVCLRPAQTGVDGQIVGGIWPRWSLSLSTCYVHTHVTVIKCPTQWNNESSHIILMSPTLRRLNLRIPHHQSVRMQLALDWLHHSACVSRSGHLALSRIRHLFIRDLPEPTHTYIEQNLQKTPSLWYCSTWYSILNYFLAPGSYGHLTLSRLQNLLLRDLPEHTHIHTFNIIYNSLNLIVFNIADTQSPTIFSQHVVGSRVYDSTSASYHRPTKKLRAGEGNNRRVYQQTGQRLGHLTPSDTRAEPLCAI